MWAVEFNGGQPNNEPPKILQQFYSPYGNLDQE